MVGDSNTSGARVNWIGLSNACTPRHFRLARTKAHAISAYVLQKPKSMLNTYGLL